MGANKLRVGAKNIEMIDHFVKIKNNQTTVPASHHIYYFFYHQICLIAGVYHTGSGRPNELYQYFQ